MKIEQVIVQVPDIDKLIELINIPLPENQKLYIDKFAIFGTRYGIDADCMFWDLYSEYIDGVIKPVVSIGIRIKHFNKNGGYQIRMDKDDFVKNIAVDDLLKISTSQNLVDFIRFNYNPRIEGNQRLLMKYINNKP